MIVLGRPTPMEEPYEVVVKEHACYIYRNDVAINNLGYIYALCGGRETSIRVANEICNILNTQRKCWIAAYKWEKERELKERYKQLEKTLEDAMTILMKLREQNPSENLTDAEQSLDDAITFLHGFEDEQFVYRTEQK